MRNHWLNAVGAALSDHPLEKGTSNSGAYRGAPLHYFRKRGTITPPFSKGRLGGIFLRMNSKGLSVLFLVFAMLLMVTIGYVFSYLIPTKQKSIIFPIHSNQVFFIAQSGVEYAIRYGSDQGWRSATDLIRLNDVGAYQRNLGNGRFIINYNNVTDTLTSTGEITGSSEKRIVKVSNMTQFIRLIFDPASPVPCWNLGTRRAHFYLKNVRNTDVTLTAFSASWTQNPPIRQISGIYIGSNEKYGGSYISGSGMTNFNRPSGGPFSPTISAGAVYEVEIRWDNDVTNGANILITFYTAAGEGYTFNLNSAGNGLPNC